jgi:hypothetical protein
MFKSALVVFLAAWPFLAGAENASDYKTGQTVPQSLAGKERRDPLEHWEFDYESGVIQKVGGGATPLDYVVILQLLTLKTPAVAHRAFAGGDLIMRSRFSLLIEPIVKGPETRYIGASASGCVEWWNLQRTLSFFFTSGGGLGFMDSKGHQIAGAQGQDLNFNWLVYLGARKRWTERSSASLGLYFQHVSNTGLDKINPGLNALGPVLSYAWHY